MAKQTFLQGTLILIASGVIVKLLGFVNKAVIFRVVGEEGFGLFTMAFPTLILTVTLTQMGLPIAISKMVSEADAFGDREKIKRILIVSLTTTGTLSIIFTTAMVLIAPVLSKTVFPDQRVMIPLLAIAPIVPIVALSSVLRGYFQGRQNMKPYAIAQVVEQTVRICFSVVLALLLLPYGVAYGAAGVLMGNVIGELASLIYMFTMFKLKKRIRVRKGFWTYVKGGKQTFDDLMRVALPATGSRMVGSISYFFEPIIITTSLILAGVSTEMATRQYGELAGLVLPFLTLPSFITHSLSVSLIPTVSEAAAKKRFDIVHNRLHQALKISMITGGITVIIAYVFADPLMKLIYDAPQISPYVKLMAPFFFIFFFQQPLQAALQALGHARAAMMNSVFGAIVKMATIFALASRPELGIIGAALGFVMNVVLVTLLHFSTVVKAAGFTLIVRDYVKGLLCIAATIWMAWILQQYALPNGALAVRTLLLVFIVSVIYLILIGTSGLFKREEIKQIPFIGKLSGKWIK